MDQYPKWALLECRADFKAYKVNKDREGLLDLPSSSYHLDIRKNGRRRKIKIEHDPYNKPDHYPCMVTSVFLAQAVDRPQYEHHFLYYDTAVQLVDATEEDRNDTPINKDK